jgi:hypothetical protein
VKGAAAGRVKPSLIISPGKIGVRGSVALGR